MGTRVDGMAIVIPWAGVLVVGDYLSPVEIPTLNAGGPVERTWRTLERLRALSGASSTSFRATAPCSTRERALAVLDEDIAYLEALRRGRRDAGCRRAGARGAAAPRTSATSRSSASSTAACVARASASSSGRS